jgi:urease accessory protein
MCPDDGARPAGWRASLELDFGRRGERTVLVNRRHDGPLVVQKPLYPEDGTCHAIVVHPPAGIAGGDALALSLLARDGASVLVTTPGAAKWYRSSGPAASQHVRLQADAAATLEWLPQENIVFDGARAHVEWRAELVGDARMIAWDIYCLGRTGSGERFTRGRCAIETRILRDGRLVWIERAQLAPASDATGTVAGLADMPVFGTLAIAAPVIDDAWLVAARGVPCAKGEAGVTRLPGLLLARYRGASSEAARRYFTSIWSSLREPVLGRAAVPPRIWST